MKIENLIYTKRGLISTVQFLTDDAGRFNYISLRTALRSGRFEVKEIGESGSVKDLKVFNNSDQFVFISDGDILEGAKQNRVLNASVLLKPESVTVIPVSCVEAGRWRYTTSNFEASPYYEPGMMRAAKLKTVSSYLKTGHRHASDQSEVWSNVADYEKRKKSDSMTSNLSDIFHSEMEIKGKKLNDIFPEAGCNGTAIFIGPHLISIESFNSPKVYAEYFPKLVNSAVMDTDLYEYREIDESVAKEEVMNVLSRLSRLPFEEHKAVAAGLERRYTCNEMASYNLDMNNINIHSATLFSKVEEQTGPVILRGGEKIVNFGRYKGMRLTDLLRSDSYAFMDIILSHEIDDDLKHEILDELLRIRNSEMRF